MGSLVNTVCRLGGMTINELPTFMEQIFINNTKSAQKLQLVTSSCAFYDLLGEITTSPRQLSERITHSVTSCHSLIIETAEITNKLVQLLAQVTSCLHNQNPKSDDAKSQFLLYNISRNVLVQTNILAFLLHQLIQSPDDQSPLESAIRNHKQTLSVMLSKVRSLSNVDN